MRNEQLPANDKKFEQETSNALFDAVKDTLGPLVDGAATTAGALPVVGVGVGIYKMARAALGYRFEKKLHAFIEGVRAGSVTEVEINDWFNRLQPPHEREKIMAEVIDTLDRLRDEAKARIYANIFSAFVRGELGWEIFVPLAQCLEQLNSGGFNCLLRVGIVGFSDQAPKDRGFYEGLLLAAGVGSKDGQKFRLNDYGMSLVQYGFLTSQEHREAIALIRDTEKARYENILKDELIPIFKKMSKEDRNVYREAYYDHHQRRTGVIEALRLADQKK